MDNSFSWLLQNGTSASPNLGEFNRYHDGGTFHIFTLNENDIGQHKTILRGCSSFNELIELYLEVIVISNTYPDFVEELQTTFIVYVNETLEYKLPAAYDDDGNDTPVVIIEYDSEIPPFMFYDNITQTITFKPDDNRLMGQVFYFRVVVKEENSDYVQYSYSC